jgi:hypothetical protein
MGESNDERIARKKRERQEYLKQQAAQEKADAELAARLDSDPEFAEQFDDSFERNLSKFDEEFMRKFAKDKGYSKAETQAMLDAAERAKKAMRGGWFSERDPVKAEKIIMSNRGMRELKQSKKDKSCFLFALVILAGSGATSVGLIWGAVEMLSRLFS